MVEDKPQTLEAYKDWARTNLSCDFDEPTTKTRYTANVNSALMAIQESAFWKELVPFLEIVDSNHLARTGADMLMKSEAVLSIKPFQSSVDKSFRHNVLWNHRWPHSPKVGWATPDSWYSTFDDLVRSTLVCKFLDGPCALAEALKDHATAKGLESVHSPRGLDNGYYAYHHYTTFDLTLADAKWATFQAQVKLELQLTTQLQEVLRKLTHPLYERARLSTEPKNDAWKWDYDTPRFQTAYLGHTIHLIEAVIVQVRDMPAGQAPDHATTSTAPETAPVPFLTAAREVSHSIPQPALVVREPNNE